MPFNMKNIPEEYELIFSEYINEIKSETALVKHKKTGARIALISNDDTNKVFNIGFKTPPADSTGVAHIMEHSVLCGSKNFPAKDPFIELCKGSLNTFLNAMTYPDKTIYPVASYNDTDFQNLMHVYLDSVFHPNVYIHDEIFRQEGWHYELEEKDGELTYNGVVYNEMKGAYSSPDQVLLRKITDTLFPDTIYSVESGGDPVNIPDLTYEQFLDFHRKYYHPSNCFIYLYGDMDMAEKLNFIHEEYLSEFEAITVDSAIPSQKAFDQISYCEDSYPVGSEEEAENASYLAYSWVIGEKISLELALTFNILEYALMEVAGAPLKQKLLDLELGEDIYGSFETSILQPYLSIVVKNIDASDRDQIISVINEELVKLANGGLNKRTLEGALNYYEFKTRENDFGRWPKGLMYGLQMLDSWLYDEMKPFDYLKYEAVYKSLREKLDTDYFENVIREYLIHNTHSSVMLLNPEIGLTEKKENELKDKLSEYKKSLSDEQIEKIIADTVQLKAYQSEPSAKEDIEKIPLLSIDDITKEAEPLFNTEKETDHAKYLLHDLETNGIDYIKLIFDISSIEEEEIPYVGILQEVLGDMDTEAFSYQELVDEMNLHTGGISTSAKTYGVDENDTYKPVFSVEGKCLSEKLSTMLYLMEEIALRTDFTDDKRLKEILNQSKSRMEMGFMSSGHAAAVRRASSYFSDASWFRELTDGIAYYEFMSEILADYDNKKQEVIGHLKKLITRIFRSENLLIDWINTEDCFEAGKEKTDALVTKLYDTELTENEKSKKVMGVCPSRNEAFTTSGMVQYNALCGDYRKAGLEFNGSLIVLKNILGNEYLWNNVRVKGGAYGCMCSFAASGSSYFTSYRDPNVDSTYEVYENAGEYIRSLEMDEREMTKYIIGAIGGVDIPSTASMKGELSLAAYLSKRSYEDLQNVRDELLSTNVDKLRNLAGHIEAIVEHGFVCAVGSDSQLSKENNRFNYVKQLMK